MCYDLNFDSKCMTFFQKIDKQDLRYSDSKACNGQKIVGHKILQKNWQIISQKINPKICQKKWQKILQEFVKKLVKKFVKKICQQIL